MEPWVEQLTPERRLDYDILVERRESLILEWEALFTELLLLKQSVSLDLPGRDLPRLDRAEPEATTQDKIPLPVPHKKRGGGRPKGEFPTFSRDVVAAVYKIFDGGTLGTPEVLSALEDMSCFTKAELPATTTIFYMRERWREKKNSSTTCPDATGLDATKPDETSQDKIFVTKRTGGTIRTFKDKNPPVVDLRPRVDETALAVGLISSLDLAWALGTSQATVERDAANQGWPRRDGKYVVSELPFPVLSKLKKLFKELR